MVWLLYNILFVIGFVALLPRFIYRMCRRGGYWRNFWQRAGVYPRDLQERLRGGSWIWIQAVSVGELYVALRFMDRLRARRPGLRFVLSTNTSTGYAIAVRQMRAEDALIYFPVDFPPVMRRVLGVIRPTALILVELELWPNLIRLAKGQGVPVALINGRISDHSYHGYRLVRLFTRHTLPLVDLMCVQSAGDGEKLVNLGAPADRVRVVGSAKYEVAQLDPEAERRAQEVLASVGFGDGRLVLLGGSTWPGEEAGLLDAYKELKASHPDLVLVLAPRHAERAGDVLREIGSRGLTVVRRSEIGRQAGGARPDVLLIDTTGELKSFYPCAAVIFIGKSLTRHGGQNIVEPAIYGKPIVVGPNMENFAVIAADFLAADAIIQVPDAARLREAVAALLADPARRAACGERAARLVREKAGALETTIELLNPLFR